MSEVKKDGQHFDVSIVIPARNAAATIAETLRSVLVQAKLAEVIVVDDGSTDGTAGIVNALGDPRIRLISGPCTGIAGALNAGFRAAAFPYIARCDADDLYLPGRLIRQADWLDRHPDYVAISGGFQSIDHKGRMLAELACDGLDRDVTDILRNGQAMTHLCTWLVRRKAILATGGARPWFETAEDVDLQLRLAFQGRVWHAPGPVYGYRLHDNSITHSRKAAQLEFFDNAARTFAAQRRESGTDALDRGNPPPLPDFGAIAGGQNHALGQIVGHLTSQAWANFRQGRRLEGIGTILRALAKQPFGVALWKGLLLMLARSLFRQH